MEIDMRHKLLAKTIRTLISVETACNDGRAALFRL